MNENTMEWIPIYDYDDDVRFIDGYECSNCSYFSRTTYAVCPFCKRRRAEKCEELDLRR